MQVMEGSLPPTAGLSPYHPKQVGIHEINFTTPEELEKMIKNARTSMEERLPTIFGKMFLYLNHHKYQNSIYKSIKLSILQNWEKLNSIITEEYMNKNVQSVTPVNIQSLMIKMDSLFTKSRDKKVSNFST
eukprot:TRINITY_DN7195_c0_g1_i2.p1 TRINITY_DN7195_c0_g1~~TRINITY_DN7195_c0_g1_i2.p1  ORF type:complete len:131 (-),score=23.72 TRINITY_DN7195_c0_g1_i2:145-537(-)